MKLSAHGVSMEVTEIPQGLYVGGLVVDPELRGQGVANGFLWEQMHNFLETIKHTDLWAHAIPQLVKWYERFGFTPIEGGLEINSEDEADIERRKAKGIVTLHRKGE